jgi:hypothetical protein
MLMARSFQPQTPRSVTYPLHEGAEPPRTQPILLPFLSQNPKNGQPIETMNEEALVPSVFHPHHKKHPQHPDARSKFVRIEIGVVP